MSDVKKVVIVGGVAGGMSCAMRLRRLREDVAIDVFERNPDVSIASCGMPYYIGGEIKDRAKLAVVTPTFAKVRFNVNAHTRHEVLSIDRGHKTVSVRSLETGEVSEHAYDRLVLCPGARPITAGIVGADLPGVSCLRSLADMDAVAAKVGEGKRAVVIGCSFIGLELVEALIAKGVKTTVIELLPQVLGVLDAEMTVPLKASLELHGVDCRLGRKTQSIEKAEDGSLLVNLDDGSKIPADTVVLSIGVTPDSQLASQAGLETAPGGAIVVDDQMRTSDPSVYACGDAVQVQNYVTGKPMVLALAGPASRQARVAASSIAGLSGHRFGGVNGTAIVRAFEMVAGCTGLTEKAAKRAGMTGVRKCYVVAGSTVDWLPGGATMILKLLFDGESGRVLGLQAVGRSGVDKRLDVASVAIQAGMTVQQLSQVELSYAPPFNGPKDPINVAGFVACNMMEGLVQMAYPDSIPEGSAIVDLREDPELPVQGEYANALRFPMSKLRSRIDELPKDKTLILGCKVGGRGNAAYRLLSQKGFKCLDLSGGAMVYNMFHNQEAYKRMIASKFF